MKVVLLSKDLMVGIGAKGGRLIQCIMRTGNLVNNVNWVWFVCFSNFKSYVNEHICFLIQYMYFVCSFNMSV